jgi:hypothetical protein
MLRSPEICAEYDLNSAVALVTGAAPLGQETALDFQKRYPKVAIRQAYGRSSAS